VHILGKINEVTRSTFGTLCTKPGRKMLQYLRSKTFDALVVLWTLLLSPALPALWSVNARGEHVRAVSQFWANGIMFLLKTVVRLNYVERGRENISNGPCIIVCNHQSVWETIALTTLFADASFVAKIELLRIPVVGWFLHKYPMIMLNRSAGRAAARRLLDESAEAIREGRRIIIFPQGTRCAVDEPVKFKRGIAALYSHLRVPVLPVALNSGVFWSSDQLMKYSGTITVSYLSEIDPELDPVEFQLRAEKAIADEAGKLVAELDIEPWLQALG
jgi:1-acyl-sn-glycerol-3-phosphate acyltransferase